MTEKGAYNSTKEKNSSNPNFCEQNLNEEEANNLSKKIFSVNYLSIGFFDVKTQGNKRTATCSKCKNIFCDYGTSTGNFKKHLISCCPEKLASYKNLKNENRKDLVVSTSDKAKPLTNETITYFIVKFLIVLCLLPYRLVEMKGFICFMKLICPKWVPVGRYSIQKIINEMNQISDKESKKLLDSAKFVSITADLWSDRQQRSYLGVTAHFLNKNFELKNLTIALRVFNGIHTGQQIYKELIEILNNNNLINKVVKIHR